MRTTRTTTTKGQLKKKGKKRNHTPKKNRLSKGKLVLKRRSNCASHSQELLPFRKHCRVLLAYFAGKCYRQDASQASAFPAKQGLLLHRATMLGCSLDQPEHPRAECAGGTGTPGPPPLKHGLQNKLWGIFLVSNVQHKPPSRVAKHTGNRFVKPFEA